MRNFYSYNEYIDICYAGNDNRKFNLFIPKKSRYASSLFVFIHGGGWKSGSPDEFENDMKRITEKYGISTASVGYRFISDKYDIIFSDIYNDIKNGIHTVKRYMQNLGFEPKKIAVGGLSAGACNAMYYAFKESDKNPGSIAFVMDKFGPNDFTDSIYYKGTNELPSDMAYRIFGQYIGIKFDENNFFDENVQSKLKEASPYFLINEHTPPTIVSNGTLDEVVPIESSIKLHEKIKSFGIKTDFVIMEGCKHTYENAELDKLYNQKLDEYIKKFLL